MSEKQHKTKKICDLPKCNSEKLSWAAMILFQSMVFDVMRIISTQIRWRETC